MSNRVTAIQMPEGLMQNKAVTGMQQLAKDFKAFLARGSLIDLAVGYVTSARLFIIDPHNNQPIATSIIIIGGAFNTIVQSFVNDIITPIISLIGQKNLGELRCSGYPFASLKAQQENLFLVIKCNASSTICHTGENSAYATIAIAQTDGAVTWNYGRFIQNVIYFLIVSVVMFFVVKVYTR
ncbi:hypothetical protein HDU84_008725 [Entophlyctis sp. JEL0112]|nr:hypothetical protein HDU84_008725 [Entophlyctis sp. JEL0112]